MPWTLLSPLLKLLYTRKINDMLKSQIQMYWDAHRKVASLNHAFMTMVNDPVNPMTQKDLRRLIEKRPEVYGRFKGFLRESEGTIRETN